MSKYTIVVPARLESTRLPRKLLLDDTGKTLLEHSLENLQVLRDEAELFLVTDSELLAEKGKALVDSVHISTREFESGTARISEILSQIKTDYLLNVQADEPEMDAGALKSLMARMMSETDVQMATLGTPFTSKESWQNHNAVKVLCGHNDKALYFSRTALPYGGSFDSPGVLHHIGVYAYKKELLARWGSLPQGHFESLERLEQLRALENDISLLVLPVSCAQKGIDTLEDYNHFKNRLG
ncbi:MAG: 3-deoxy-manno-octulosonate cytidylyltransferase [Planctomycetes bacterium]|nr:3-deoxy-manno-octulosonate cytidylyltransferase [Planctomycetota bacterium]